MKPICNLEERTEFCDMNGDIRIDGRSSTVFMAASSQAGTLVENSSWLISPYARKGDEEALNHVTKWSVKSGVDGYAVPQCDQNHRVPAIVFSIGGYAGNNFHDYTDIVIPLYLTSRQFDGEVKFLITNKKPLWINKFQNILEKLSRYELMDIDKEEHIHCFTSVIVGLKRNPKELTIDSSKSPYSMKEFRQFLRSAYSLQKVSTIKMRDNDEKIRRPRLLILSRKRTRAFTNTNDIAEMARRLGYEVVIAEADLNVARVAKIVNSCDVMMGVHGAGLTNMVFLPENAILIQVVPIGGFEWLARTDFEEPSTDMNIRYLEYKIKTEESTLIQQYPPEHEVLSNPYAIGKQGWYAFKSVYLEKQNVNLDVNRFRPTLLRALELLHQ
ncbi:protein O-linked-mannose beta-1,4-N-acetylglucosaminyltransferase 2-like [Durio zibethinus]|uniref:Protein O-linked-mannose beta-1,4-N-acetylglucosaminyltransferase 2-like n=1 Tax=Durio zibethinus TaxID=66656 RepID=A0A6P5YE65_DURZI|nr:protein O-linked-mannose beta-1,4-N-acetylglucosaminyltransferase 2-like [Durio zibethinus]